MREEPRIGVYVCHCGSNIAGTVDVDNVMVAIGQPAQAPLSFSLTIPSLTSTSSTSPPSACRAGLT